MNHTAARNSLDAYWMPFTPNRRFKARPKLLERAEGMHYYTPEGRKVLDATAGLWCVNAGHGRPQIVEAIQRQAARMGYATAFNVGHPQAFELASHLAELMPGDLDHVDRIILKVDATGSFRVWSGPIYIDDIGWR